MTAQTDQRRAEQHEARVIVPGEAPFPPQTILLATLLASVVAGGYLTAQNWRRFYQDAVARRTLIGVSVGYVIGLALVLLVYAATGQVAVVLLAVLINAAAGIALVYAQREPYAEWVYRYGAPTRATAHLAGQWLPLASIVFINLGILLPFVVFDALPGLNALLPGAAVQRDGLTLTLTRRWREVDISADPVCQLADHICLIALVLDTGQTVFDAVYVTGDDRPADAIGADLWADAAVESPDADLLDQDAVTLARQAAVRLTYTIPNPYPDVSVARLRLWRYVVPVEVGYYRLTIMTADPDLLRLDGGPVADLLNSLSLTPPPA